MHYDTRMESTTPPTASNAQRWLMASVGVLAVVIGGIGVVVPGLPTTIFLILASWCFTRSCPWLEQRLLRNRFFAPYMRYLDGEAAMSWRGKALSIALMWLFVTLSSLTMLRADRGLEWLAACIVLLGVIGMVFIIRWRPRRVAAEPVPAAEAETPKSLNA